jgi:molybdopterin biosynthesis enzyme
MPSSFDDALSEVLALGSSHGRTPSQRININNAVDRVTSVDVFARRCLPGFDNSAMDGICVSSSYCSLSSPDSHIDLRVMGSIAAGDVLLIFDHDVEEDMCWEIMTLEPRSNSMFLAKLYVFSSSSLLQSSDSKDITQTNEHA